MESQRFQQTKITVVCNLALCILALGCSKNDEEITPSNGDKPQPPVTFISKTIGSGGGTIALDSMAIYVPAGAFSSSIDLELAVEKAPSAHPQPAVTSVYKLKGLPANFDKPIQLILKYRGTLEDDYYIAHGYRETLPITDTVYTAHRLLDCQDSAGYLTGYLVPYDENSNSGGRRASHLSDQEFQEIIDTFNGVDGHLPYHSVQSGFIINYSKTLGRSVVEQINDALEDVYEVFQELGFDPTNFPGFEETKDVSVLDLRNTGSNTARKNEFDWNNVEYSFRIHSLPLKEESLSLRVGVCFLGYFLDNYIYPTRNMREIDKWRPVDYSISMWMQESWTDPYLFKQIITEWFQSDLTYINLSIFFKYLYSFEVIKYLSTIEAPEKFFKKYYLAVKNGNDCLPSLIHSIPQSVDTWLPDYYKQLFVGNIYDIPGEVIEEKILGDEKVAYRKQLPQPKVTDTHEAQLIDLSARVFNFDIKSPHLTETSQLTFSLSSDDLDAERLHGLLFSKDINSNEISFIEKGSQIELSDPYEYKKAEKDLLLVVVNSQSQNVEASREDHLSKVKVKVTMDEILRYHHPRIYLDSIIETWEYWNGTIWKAPGYSNNSFGELPDYDEYKGSFSKDNVFTGGWDYFYEPENGNVQHRQGNVRITMDPNSYLITSFDFEEISTLLDNSGKYDYISKYTRRISGINVLLSPSYGGLKGRRKGSDILDHNVELEKSNYYGDPDMNQKHGHRVRKENIKFTEDSALKIFFRGD